MTKQVFGNTQSSFVFEEFPPRPVGLAMKRGLHGKCPCCGEGNMFSRWITVADKCDECGEELYQQRADDLPAYVNIFLVGHVVVGFMLYVSTLEIMNMWVLMALTTILAVASAILGLRPVKGAVVGFQWAKYMHGFGGDET